MITFKGYVRPDGKVGVRNYVVAIANASCATGIINKIVAQVPEVVPLIHTDGCSAPGEYDRWRMFLHGIGDNPNIFATILIGVGCETDDAKEQAAIIAKNGKPIFAEIVQDDGGGEKVTQDAVEFAKKALVESKKCKRTEVPLSNLILGTECGGSDALSGLTANPVIGYVSDFVVNNGGTAILTETTELIGTEDILYRRAINKQVGDKIKKIIYDQEIAVRNVMGEGASRMIARGNMAGGMSTIQEKSLGCIRKGGTTTIMDVIDYGEPVGNRKGLIIMDGPGYDPDSIAGEFASGAQVICFSTGRGNPLGFPVAPVIKICSNTITFEKVGGVGGDMDINAGAIITAGKSLEELGEEAVKYLLATINGRETMPEKHGYGGALCVYSSTSPF
ncbi:UxaA family hydrolase [Treponema sp. Marseille-Q4523]|uniref:UxaA family hydrolase n=1 Tax=Treponema sp. Marseille-Q4523 TaxID=2810610 RepID=UPI001960E402|nr:UxaA family hydrolase [Treponema sp. Marseille-Q4523]MBM7022118.1 UxaA family hydrolase [Treponema sp. Marseille-Q4523]